MLQEVNFVCHGGGPIPLLEYMQGESDKRLVSHLKSLKLNKKIVVVSAHWDEPEIRVGTTLDGSATHKL